MTKVAIFAHYDKNNIIQEYVIYYLKELRKVADIVVFVSDSDLPEYETNKITAIVHKIIARHHGEYDFGSYKRGYKYLDENNMLCCEELILANDSCIGPLCSFSIIWDSMNKLECDFWGMNSNDINVFPHIQSFFIVFKNNVFKSKLFKDFMCGIKKLDTKDEIIQKYEIGLSKLLVANGYKMASYLKFANGETAISELVYPDILVPLVKTSLLRNLSLVMTLCVLWYLKRKFSCSYPLSLIKQYYLSNECSVNMLLFRRLIIRIHFKEKRCCVFGRWYHW